MSASAKTAMLAGILVTAITLACIEAVHALWPDASEKEAMRLGALLMMAWMLMQWAAARRLSRQLRLAVAGEREAGGAPSFPSRLIAWLTLLMLTAFGWVERPVFRAARPGSEVTMLAGRAFVRARVLGKARLRGPLGLSLPVLIVDRGRGAEPALLDEVTALRV